MTHDQKETILRRFIVIFFDSYLQFSRCFKEIRPKLEAFYGIGPKFGEEGTLTHQNADKNTPLADVFEPFLLTPNQCAF